MFWFALLLGICLVGTAWAQPGRRPGGPPAFGPGARQQPGRGAAPRNTGPGARKSTGTPAAQQTEEIPTEIPPGYQPPKEIPPQITLEKPLKPFPDQPGTAQEQLESLRKELQRAQITRILRDASWNNDAKKYVPLWAKYYLFSMTLPENRSNLNDLRDTFLRQLNSAGQLAANSTAAQTFRANVAQEIVARAEELLDNNFAARMQAVVILSYLNETEDNPKLGTRLRPYLPVVEVLLKVIASPDQLEPTKIAAVNGIKRILLVAGRSVPAEKKHEIARTLVKELEKSDTHFWYQMRLAETLGAIDQRLTILPNGQAKPIIVETLVKAILDQKRHWCARSHAARALGRATIDASVNLELIGFALTRLANEMSSAYNQDPNQWYWKSCFWDLYLAFRPVDQEETQKYDKPGLLSRFSDPPIAKAHELTLPIIRHVLSQDNEKRQPLPRELVNATSDWLQNNQPANLQLFPGGDQILSAGTEEGAAAVARTRGSGSR